jgi:hypothetical protein
MAKLSVDIVYLFICKSRRATTPISTRMTSRVRCDYFLHRGHLDFCDQIDRKRLSIAIICQGRYLGRLQCQPLLVDLVICHDVHGVVVNQDVLLLWLLMVQVYIEW